MSKFTVLVIIAILFTVWILVNPRGKFGYSTFGLTTYNALPIPYFDVKIRADGVLSLRKDKNHFVSLNESQEMLDNSPDFLIIGTGYENMVKVDENIFNETFVQVEVIETPKALERFNELKEQGKRIAAIIHSTC